jgi:hypothetical protein
MTIAVNQSVEKNTLSSTITATGGTGDRALIVCVGSYNATFQGTISSVKLGTTNLVQAITDTDTSDGFASCWIYYLLGIASGQTSVVVTGSNLSVASSDGGVYIAEVSGLALASALDKTASGNSDSGPPYTYSSGSSGTLSQADEFVIGLADGVTLSNASGWTAIGSANGSACGYKIVSATTAQTFNGVASAPGNGAVLASFKAPSTNINKAVAAIASML